jgi:SAM-dependent methyltransferase
MGGNGQLLTKGADLSSSEAEASRDHHAIAVASSLAGRSLFDPYIEPLIQRLHPTGIADLGCGSGERLIAWSKRYGTRGIGIDRSIHAIKLAEDAIGLDDGLQLKFRNADVGTLEDEFPGIDLIFSALMAHDLLPEHRAITIFRRLQKNFPNARNMIIVDTCRLDGNEGIGFADCFQYVHALLDQEVPAPHKWEKILALAGWTVVEKAALGLENTFVFVCERS